MIREKLKIKNAEIKVIKWMRVWNDKREREREREMIFATATSQVTKESKIIVIAKPKRA